MATYITIQTTNDVSVVKSVHPTAALAEAAVEKAKPEVWAAVDDPVTDDVEPGWYYTAAVMGPAPELSKPASVSPDSARSFISDHRTELRELWRIAERAYSALWDNATVYGRWIEMNCRAAAVDANLSTASQLTVLLSEAQVAGDWWQVNHNATQWANVLVDDRSTWTYHWTDNEGIPNDRAAMALTDDTDFNWIAWLREDA